MVKSEMIILSCFDGRMPIAAAGAPSTCFLTHWVYPNIGGNAASTAAAGMSWLAGGKWHLEKSRIIYVRRRILAMASAST